MTRTSQPFRSVRRRRRDVIPELERLDTVCLPSVAAVANVYHFYDAYGDLITYGVSPAGKLAFFVENFTNGKTVGRLYDDAGNLTGYAIDFSDASGNKYFYTYSPQGTLTHFEKDTPDGLAVTISLSNGRTFAYTVTRFDGYGGKQTSFYDGSGQLTLFEQDSPGRVVTTRFANGAVAGYTYAAADGSGNQVYDVFNGGGVVTFARVIRSDGNVYTSSYDDSGHPTGSTQANVDASGNRIVRTFDANNSLTTYAERFTNGTITVATFRGGVETGYSVTTFNAAGTALTRFRSPSGNLLGSKVTTTDALGDTLVFSFDARGNASGFIEYRSDGSTTTTPITSAIHTARTGGFLDSLLGPDLAGVVGPMAFPLSYGVDAFNFNSLYNANYNALSTFDSYLPASSFGWNYTAQLGSLSAQYLWESALGNLFQGELRNLLI